MNNETWAQFAEKPHRTKLTHMYASECLLQRGCKAEMIKIIEANQNVLGPVQIYYYEVVVVR